MGREGWVQPAQRRDLGRVNQALDTLRRQAAGQKVIERSPQRIDVGASIGRAVAVLLRRAVARGESPRPDGRPPALLEELADAKVNEHGPAVAGDANVGRLDVTVDDRRGLLVEIGQCVADLRDPGDDLLLWQRAQAN